jgi:ABC-type spermidine/putrescine transport system permease subunit II
MLLGSAPPVTSRRREQSMTTAVCLAVAAIVLGTVAALALCRNGGAE